MARFSQPRFVDHSARPRVFGDARLPAALTSLTWHVLSGLLILSIAASACEETTVSEPRPLELTLAVSPESAPVWVGDTLELLAVRGGREADRLSLGLLTWTGSGTATVTARAGTFSDRADIVAYREGDLLASYAFYHRSFINGVAVGEDGAVYLLRTDGLQLVSLDSALLLRWSRDVGSSRMNPAIGPVGRIHVTPFGATMADISPPLGKDLDNATWNYRMNLRFGGGRSECAWHYGSRVERDPRRVGWDRQAVTGGFKVTHTADFRRCATMVATCLQKRS